MCIGWPFCFLIYPCCHPSYLYVTWDKIGIFKQYRIFSNNLLPTTGSAQHIVWICQIQWYYKAWLKLGRNTIPCTFLYAGLHLREWWGAFVTLSWMFSPLGILGAFTLNAALVCMQQQIQVQGYALHLSWRRQISHFCLFQALVESWNLFCEMLCKLVSEILCTFSMILLVWVD